MQSVFGSMTLHGVASHLALGSWIGLFINITDIGNCAQWLAPEPSPAKDPLHENNVNCISREIEHCINECHLPGS